MTSDWYRYLVTLVPKRKQTAEMSGRRLPDPFWGARRDDGCLEGPMTQLAAWVVAKGGRLAQVPYFLSTPVAGK